MRLTTLDKIFKINPGTDLELNKLNLKCKEIRFVSRTRKNNGISAYVKKETFIIPNPPNTISVALGSSSVLYAFLQDEPYYSGRDIAYLTPIKPLTKNEMLFYCMCIRANRYRYNFGRQANKTIDCLLVPEYDEIPEYVNTTDIIGFDNIEEKYSDEVFDSKKVQYMNFLFTDVLHNVSETKKHVYSNVNLISAQTVENGIKDKVYTNTYIEGNKITITSNGINTGTAFFQQDAFVTQDCIAFELIGHELNKYIAMYLVTIINKNKYKFNYGRKSGRSRLEKLVLQLPIDENGLPNYKMMEDYIKSLRYSKAL